MTKRRTIMKRPKSARPPVRSERPRRNLRLACLFAIVLFSAILAAYWTSLGGALREVAVMAALALRGAADTDMQTSVAVTRQLANRLAQQERYAAAARVYSLLLRQDDSNPRDTHSLAFVLHSDGKTAEAIQLTETLLVRHPDYQPAQDALTVMCGQTSP